MQSCFSIFYFIHIHVNSFNLYRKGMRCTNSREQHQLYNHHEECKYLLHSPVNAHFNASPSTSLFTCIFIKMPDAGCRAALLRAGYGGLICLLEAVFKEWLLLYSSHSTYPVLRKHTVMLYAMGFVQPCWCNTNNLPFPPASPTIFLSLTLGTQAQAFSQHVNAVFSL